MVILGISEAHDAHACIIVNGKLLAAVSEERFTRIKSDSRYPKNSIDCVLKSTSIDPKEIDIVAFASSSKWVWQV